MNVAAFSDVFENSLRVQARPDLIIPVASLPGLMVLKLFAWLDRHEERDVQDIRRLIETYTDTGNVNRLYEEEIVNWRGLASTLSWPELFSWGKTRSA
jgi:predicted nucleotidyltransferase